MGDKKVIKEDEKEGTVKGKKCFVIMPIADMHGYESNHFTRVYKHLLKPALNSIGFHVERADDTQESDYIVIGIVQKIIDADLVLCDLSGRNPNVMYELGIRHAFDKPVVLIKDKVTEKVFDIQGLRYCEYDSNLRIDSVEHDIVKIASAIDETFTASGNSINSIVTLARVQAPSLPAKTEVSTETQVIINAVNALSKKIESIERFNSRVTRSAFALTKDGVTFSDGSKTKFYEPVFRRSDYQVVGNLISASSTGIRSEVVIDLKDDEGNFTRWVSTAAESEILTGVPF